MVVQRIIVFLYQISDIVAKMLRKMSRVFRFSQQKYFLDQYYKNVTAVALDTPGALSRMSNVFSSYGVNLTYLRTHFQSLKKGSRVKYRIQLSLNADHHYIYQQAKQDLEVMGIEIFETDPIPVPWFPRTHADLDSIGQTLQEVKQSKEHSQFQDVQYVKRRDYIAKVAKEFKMGQSIPDIPYTDQETQLWQNIYKRLKPLQKEAMCQEFLVNIQELQNLFKIDKRIPQLAQLSDYLKHKTGFTIKPTHGILSQRQFLNAFAFKTFCSTQYLRNVKNPDYTPEPDIVHEILGHVPMFADPQVAELSQLIGLLSLGASDEEIAKLGTLYWFTLQFGVCKQKGVNKGYGAGVASSIGQIEHMLLRGPEKPRFDMLDIFRDCTEAFPIQTVQPVYKVTSNFGESLKELQRYGRQIMKPMTTVFNEYKNMVMYDRNIEASFTQDKGPKF